MSEVHQTVEDLRRRVLAGEDVSAEEYASVIDTIRSDRAAGASRPRAKSAKLPPVKVDFPSLMNKKTGGDAAA